MTLEAVLLQNGHPEDFVRFVLYMIWYPLVVVQFLASCFADHPIPHAELSKEHNPCPELRTSFLNQITFQWFTGLAILGNKRPLESEDLWSLNDHDTSKSVVPDFEKRWLPALRRYNVAKQQYNAKQQRAVEFNHEEVQIVDGNRRSSKSAGSTSKPPEHPSVLWPLFKTYKWTFLAGLIFKLTFDLMQFISPQLLRLLISFIEHKERPLWHGIVIASLMFIVALLQSMILHQYFHKMFRLGMNIRSVLTAAVFTKSLRLSNAERKNRTVGEIVNLMSVDIQRFQDMTTFIMLFWSAPLQVTLSIVFLWQILGPAVLAGLGVLIAMVPLNSFLSIKMRKYQVEQMKHKDDRLKMMSEILNGMKVLKLYAWEPSMEKMVLDIRKKEITVLKKLAFLNAATTLSWACAPFMVAVLTFGVYVMVDPENNILTPQITFVSLALFNILRFPLAIFAMIISQAVQCVVSNKRIKSFLSAEEMDPSLVDRTSATS
uniref:ABC transmembrane type-1 domain-containing protein n=1 Tax=Plectus sambesii TaxID=2011161 RepID=A0A914ULD1_9BILA